MLSRVVAIALLSVLLLIASLGCGGRNVGSGDLTGAWPRSGIYRTSRVTLSDGTLFTVQIGIGATVGKGGIRFCETSPEGIRNTGNVPFRSVTRLGTGIVVRGGPEAHTFEAPPGPHQYVIRQDGDSLAVILNRNGRSENLRLNRIAEHAPRPSRLTRTTVLPFYGEMTFNIAGAPSFGKIALLDYVWNSDYGDSYYKILIQMDQTNGYWSPGSPNDIQLVNGRADGFLVPDYYIGHDLQTLADDDSDVGGYVVSSTSQGIVVINSNWSIITSAAARCYIDIDEDSYSVLSRWGYHESGIGTDSWTNSRLMTIPLGPNLAQAGYTTTATLGSGDGYVSATLNTVQPNATVAAFTVDNSDLISAITDPTQNVNIPWLRTSTSEQPDANPTANTWVLPSFASGQSPNQFYIATYGGVSQMSNFVAYGGTFSF